MVAIFTGAGTGFERGSGSVLGSAGLLGSSALGRGGEQLFFNAATGNLMVSQRDEYLVGLGLDAAVSRTYNSLGDLSDDNGDNWRQGYDRRIVNLTGTLNTAGSTVSRVSGDGSVITYSWDATKNAYVAASGSGAYDKLTNSGGIWTWTDGDSRIKETYSEYPAGSGSWRLASQADSDGNTVSFGYTADKLTQVATADGSTLTYSWSGNNLMSVTTGYTDLATSTAKTLTRTSYTYDGQNRLSTVTVDLTPGNVADSQLYVTTYAYDGSSTRIASISQSDGSNIAITYDGSGRVATMVQTASSGVTRVTSISYGAGYTEVTDPLGLITRLDYDAGNQLTKITLPPAAPGGSQQQIQFAYNANGDVTSVTDALGNVTTYADFQNGMATTITDRLGNVVTRTYGAKSELLTETTTSSDAGSGAAAHTVRFAYDAENHLRYRVSAEGHVTDYRYTTAGQLSYTIEYPEQFYDVSGLSTTTALTEGQVNAWRDAISDRSSTKMAVNIYDARGNLSYTVDYGAATSTGNTSSAEGFTRTDFVYDQAGNLRSRYTQGRNTETFVYDGLNRLTAAVDVNGATTSYVFNDASTTTTVTYANGLTQVSTYNKAGELLSFAETAAATTLGAATGTATYGYDKDGRLRWSQDATGRKSYFLYDQLGRKVADVSSAGDVVEYRYDANNRLIATIAHGLRYTGSLTALDNADAVINPATYLPASNTSDLWSWNIYDKEGRLVQSIAGDGSTAIMSYDGAGRLVSTTSYYNKLASATLTAFKTTPPTLVTAPGANAKDAITRSFYDKDGRLIGALDGEGYLSRIIYDKAGQKVSETRFYNATLAALRAGGTFNQLVASITPDAANDRSVNYSYDGQGLLRYVVDSLGYVSQTDYDTAGQATTVTQYAATLAATSDYTYDNVKALVASGNLAASVGTRKSWTVYDTAGRAAYMIDAEGAVTANAYNAAGQLIKATQFKTARATASLPSKATMDSWATTNASATNDRVTRFYYDGSGMLRYTVDGEGYVSRSDVDAAGRITKTSTWSNKLTVGDSTTVDTLHSLVIASGGAVAETLSVYDALGRIETVTDAEGSITRFTYGANGLVTDETIAWGTADAAIVHFVHDGARRVIERHAAYTTTDVSIVKTSFNGMGEVEWVQDPLGNKTYHYYDKRGLVIRVRDAEDYITEYSYTAFGQTDTAIRRANKTVSPISVEILPAVAANAARDAVTSYTYDRRGLVIAARDADDYVTETSYTAFGQVKDVTRRYNKATGARVSGTLPSVVANATKDAVTSFEYDRRGLVTKTTDAEGYYEQYTLDAFGGRTTVRNKLGANIVNVYDRRGLLVSETLPMSAYRADGTVQASTVTNKFEYDARGNRTKMIEAFGLTEQRTTIYEYDKADRLKAKKLDAVTTVSYSDFTSSTAVTVTTSAGVIPTESYAYDAAGRLKQVTDALGGRTVYFYDDLGRKTAEVGPLGTMTEWTYDAGSNVKKTRIYGTAVTVPGLADPKPAPPADYRETKYDYDKLGRLTRTYVDNVLAGSWNGSSGVAPTSITIETLIGYDAFGNVIKTTDANGYAAYSYYDRLGRKKSQVDAENYITSWSYDAEGNVLGETRFATKYVGTPDPNGAAPTVAADATNDRVTTFEYDRNGQRTKETRADVTIATVSTANGTITESMVNSEIVYTYNGLGQVLSKTEASGDTVSYTYDSTGRLTKESRAGYTDQASANVTPTVDYLYNGLNNLARTRQGGATAVAGDRVTVYAYGANGRLSMMRTALTGATVIPADITTMTAGEAHSYDYDAAGNLVRDSYTRIKSDGVTALNEGILYRRDLLGRVTGQAIATKVSATSWTRGDGQNTAYNNYGEVSQRGINGLWQESFAYNNRGLVEKTNSGDGVWRFFVYDKQGNRSLTIEDENYTAQDLSTKTISQVLGYLGATAGATFVDGLNVTVATYDKRNAALSSILTQRELATGAARENLISSQTYNAFGEVASQIGAVGSKQATQALKDAYTSYFAYNRMGRLTKKELPLVNWTGTDGVVAQARPTEYYYYDQSGRLVASKDANGNLTSRTLLAGSGYDEAEALVTAEYHADGGIARTFYDVFGDARILRNELYDGTNATQTDDVRSYDSMGRLITQVHRGALLTENFTYDILGQRITHWNSFYGAAVKETTDYDLQGRVVSTKDFAGDITTNSYAWSATVATALGTTGGWTQATTQLGRSRTETSDIFGNVTTETDFSAHAKTNSYDKAGRLTLVSGNNGTYTTTLTHSYFNTGLTSQTVDVAGTGLNTITATYAYDANGRRTKEKYAGTVYKSVSDNSWGSYVSSTQTLQDADVSYDALGRVTLFTNKNASSVVTLTMTQEYDLNSNIVRTNTTYPDLVNGGSKLDDNWFTYDTMNRMVKVNAHRSGSTLLLEDIPDAHILSYDLAGNRKTSTRKWSDVVDMGDGGGPYKTIHVNEVETYSYDGENRLIGVTLSGGQNNGTGSVTTRDALGRVTHYTESNIGGVTQDRYNILYNARGQVTQEWTSQKKNSDTYLNKVTNSYSATTGELTTSTSDNYKNGSDGNADDTLLTNYSWYDAGKIKDQRYDRNTGDSGNSIYQSLYTYDGLGRLQRVWIDDGINQAVHFAITPDEQILQREINNSGPNDPEDHHLFLNGVQLAEYTTDANKNIHEFDYAASMFNHMWTPSGSGTKFYNGGASVMGGEFGTSNYNPLNPLTAGTSSGGAARYTVKAGDTLEGVAAALWGDASLWYKLAEVNGLSAGSSLVEGQSLSVPSGVVKNSNNAATFNPYDTARATGDLAPTTRKPPKKNKCGAFGQILLVAISIAVAVVLPQVAPAVFGGFGGGVGAAAVGSIVSQGVGVATGIQDKFSWTSVALSALSAGVAQGVGDVVGKGAMLGSKIVGGAVRGAVSSALTQGIAVATGLQDRFDWAGVAAAGVGGGASAAVGTIKGFNQLSSTAQRFTSSMASGIANAATRSLINGSDFGGNLLAALPDVLGQTVGGMVEDGVAGRTTRASAVGDSNTDTAAAQEPVAGVEGGGQLGNGQNDQGQSTLAVSAAEMEAATRSAQIERAAAEAYRRGEIDLGEYARRIGGEPVTVDGYEISGGPDAGGNQTVIRMPEDVKVYRFDGAGNIGFNEDLGDGKARFVVLTEANELADRNTMDVVRSGIAPLDTFLSGVSVARGQGSFGDYVNVLGSALPLTKPAAKFLGKTLKASEALTIARSMTHNADSRMVMLGTDHGGVRWSDEAEKMGATYFHTDKWGEMIEAYGKSGMLKINREFLKDQMRAGKQFLLSHNPLDAPKNSFFGREIQYLQSKGYSFVQEGSYWKAIRD